MITIGILDLETKLFLGFTDDPEVAKELSNKHTGITHCVVSEELAKLGDKGWAYTYDEKYPQSPPEHLFDEVWEDRRAFYQEKIAKAEKRHELLRKLETLQESGLYLDSEMVYGMEAEIENGKFVSMRASVRPGGAPE